MLNDKIEQINIWWHDASDTTNHIPYDPKTRMLRVQKVQEQQISS